MSTDVTYKNNTLASISSGTGTLKTAGKYLEDDITITVTGSGGGEPARKKQINFIDYDGIILYSYTKSEWQNVSDLPDNPSHDGLIAQGWNWTKAQIDAQLTAMPDGDIWVGQMYITDDGKTRIYIHLTQGRLHPYFGIRLDGTVIVDWGDNSATSTMTSSAAYTIYRDHEYASEGDYVITITVSSGSFRFYGGNQSTILRTDINSNRIECDIVYLNAIQKIEFGEGIYRFDYDAFHSCQSLKSITTPSNVTTVSGFAFQDCYSLESITIPSGVTGIGLNEFTECYSLASISIPSSVRTINNEAFSYCYSLASITIPSGVTSFGNSVFWGCHSLLSISIPSGVTQIETKTFDDCYSLTSVAIPSSVTRFCSYAFFNCRSLKSITIPSGVTVIDGYAFDECHSLTIVTIPSSVTDIGNSAFSHCYGVAEYHVLRSTPPTLGSYAFASIADDCKIYVPSASRYTYQQATNWSTYQAKIVGE